jgi:hypothetical protein
VGRNDGDKFVDLAPQLNMDHTLRTQSEGGVGCAIGDYNNDGYLDLFVATYGENLLYKNRGNGTFTEVGKAMGVIDPDHTVSAAWGDYNNDGLLDLITVGYHSVNGEAEPYGKLYKNTGNGFVTDDHFPELTRAGDHGVEWIDFDNDGDLDLSVTDGYGKKGGHFVFRNEMNQASRDKMISILVLDHNGHYTQQGAQIRFYDGNNHILGSRMVSTGGGYNAQSARPVYFSLPKVMPVIVKVTFMGESQPLEVKVHPKDLKGQPLVVYRAKKGN